MLLQQMLELTRLSLDLWASSCTEYESMKMGLWRIMEKGIFGIKINNISFSGLSDIKIYKYAFQSRSLLTIGWNMKQQITKPLRKIPRTPRTLKMVKTRLWCQTNTVIVPEK